ncbi:sulfotransferase [Rubrivirga sp. IMCC43871]|uniref:sulfotransferase n=1 Tax=Rubrivirga sp. IMCC43871 TaxID=3391575 RepID=UPI003990237F
MKRTRPPQTLAEHTRAYAHDALQTAWRFAATTAPARRHSTVFDGVERYVMFVGYPRSGHSLVGALLDAHPNAAISHEAAALKHVHARFGRDRLFAVLLADSARRGASSRGTTEYVYDVPGQWQGRFRRLRIIGDKHGEGAALRLRARPWLLGRLRRTVGVPLRIVHGVRNPYDNIATIARRAAQYDGRPLNLDAAIDRYQALCEIADHTRQCVEASEWIDLRHETLVTDPAAELRTLCLALGLDAPEDYLTACAGIVRAKPNQSRHTVAWTSAQRDAVARLTDRFETLNGYTFEA